MPARRMRVALFTADFPGQAWQAADIRLTSVIKKPYLTQSAVETSSRHEFRDARINPPLITSGRFYLRLASCLSTSCLNHGWLPSCANSHHLLLPACVC